MEKFRGWGIFKPSPWAHVIKRRTVVDDLFYPYQRSINALQKNGFKMILLMIKWYTTQLFNDKKPNPTILKLKGRQMSEKGHPI